MPTTKKRINITLTPEIEKLLKLLAQRDDVPEATKAVQLLEKAAQIEEDELWNEISEKRMAEIEEKNLKLIPYEDVFGS